MQVTNFFATNLIDHQNGIFIADYWLHILCLKVDFKQFANVQKFSETNCFS